MKDTIFSKNEIEYLKQKDSFENQYSKNYIYQIRHSLKKKLSNFILNDLKLLLSFEKNENNKRILDDDKISILLKSILKEYPYFINKIRKLPEIKNYLGKS